MVLQAKGKTFECETTERTCPNVGFWFLEDLLCKVGKFAVVNVVGPAEELGCAVHE